MKTYLFRITHLKNLSEILRHGRLWCDDERRSQNLESTGIAHQHIKDRRSRRHVPLAPGGTLADYVPFYFAPRSPMLYAIHTGSVAGYADGQAPVLHLVSSVDGVVSNNLPFVFTDSHAEMLYSKFFADTADLARIDWNIMKADFWNDTNDDGDRKRRRQAEFLVHRSFPVSLVAGIGVYSVAQAEAVEQILAGHGAASTGTRCGR